MAQPIYGSVAPEYTNELSASYLAGELAPIEQGEEDQEGQAWNEGDAGGLIGKFSTAGKIAGARSNASASESSIIGQFNMKAAQAAYGERMANQGAAFESQQNADQRNFQEMLATQGYNWQQADQGAAITGARHAAEQGEWQALGIGNLTNNIFAQGGKNSSAFTSMFSGSGGSGGSGGGGGGGSGFYSEDPYAEYPEDPTEGSPSGGMSTDSGESSTGFAALASLF